MSSRAKHQRRGRTNNPGIAVPLPSAGRARDHCVLSGERGCRPFPRTPFSASGRPPPLRSGWFCLTKSNTSWKIKRPASLRSDGVRLQPGLLFGFPSEQRSPSPESPDAEARAQNLDLAARDQLRQQQARPLLETIRQKIEAAREQALPASKLGGAVAYTLGLWERLKQFLDYPELELSTNLAENSMRGVALGRKTGSTLAVRRRGLKWQPFYRWWRPAGV